MTESDAAHWYNCFHCGQMYRHGEAVNGCCSEECHEECKREYERRSNAVPDGDT